MRFNFNSSIRSLLIVACLGFAPAAWAQGLGEIETLSSLNQPFRADIALLDIGDLDATQIIVELGSQQDFDNRGLQRPALLGTLQFEVEITGNGAGVIHVTSVAPIEEPFLNFLVSARWPNGRMLREYTSLLDLPVTAVNGVQTPAPAVQAPQTTTPASTPPAANSSTAPSSTSTATAQEYTVQNGDSLWQIASRARPGNNVSVQQMMLAIQRNNADAFINGNLNMIRSGSVLRMPTAQEISVVDQDAAVAAISQQPASQPLAVNTTTPPAGAAPQNDQLTILSGDDNQGSSSGGSDNIAALENELMMSEESLDRARLENLELTNRLAALQEQVDILQNLIALEDARVAQLQTQLSEQAAQTEQSLEEAQNAADALASEEAAQAPAEEGVAGLLKNSAVVVGGLLALVLLALGVMLVRKRNAALTDDDTFDFEATEAQARAAAAATIAQENAAAETDNSREREGLNWGAAVAAFFARFRKKGDLPDEYKDEQAPAEVTGGSYGPDAAFRNAEPEEAKIEPTLQSEEEILAAEAMANEAFEEVAAQEELLMQDESLMQDEESAFTANGDITYEEPAIVPEEDLLAEAGELLATAAPEQATAEEPVLLTDPVVEEPVLLTEAVDEEPVLLTEPVIEEPVLLTEPVEIDEPVSLAAQDEEPVLLTEPVEPEELIETLQQEVETIEAEAFAEVTIDDAGDQLEEEETADVFEFSLRTEAAVEVHDTARESEFASEIETIDFAAVSTAPASAQAPERQQLADQKPAAPEVEDDLVDLAFDENFIPDAAEEENYIPSSPNNAQDAKLDLAVAYEAMGDVDGAVEILDEVIGAGNADQIAEAERLKAKWQNS